mgnify:CR=1 FL=1|jgi:hypothetical protein
MQGIRPESLSNRELVNYAYLLQSEDTEVLRQWVKVLTERLVEQLDDNK